MLKTSSIDGRFEASASQHRVISISNGCEKKKQHRNIFLHAKGLDDSNVDDFLAFDEHVQILMATFLTVGPLYQHGELFKICSDLIVESVYDAFCWAYISYG